MVTTVVIFAAVPDFKITPVPDGRHKPFQKVFTQHINVFGVHIYATANTPDDKVLHAAKVMAEYLDNNEDGIADNPDVVQQLWLVDVLLALAHQLRDADLGVGRGACGAIRHRSVPGTRTQRLCKNRGPVIGQFVK